MKKTLIMIGIGSISGYLVFILIVAFFFAGNGGMPIPTPATEDTALSYQYAASELGAPWDIVMLADMIRAAQEGKENIEDYNPIITSLEFCVIYEEHYKKETTEKDDGTTETSWELQGTKSYPAADSILQYIGENRESLSYKDASLMIASVQKAAERKGDGDNKYEVSLMPNTEYEHVLRNYIKLSEDNIQAVLQLHEADYLAQLYNYEYVPGENVELPDVVVGDVTREELAQVAVSLMNHPYLLGGKSPYPGNPVGPLDCSGYVDWVYIQCFGHGVGFGKIPAGVGITGTAGQFYACQEISESELKVGDLGFLKDPKDVKNGQYNHVGIYLGKINGQNAWVHCGGSSFGYADRPRGRVGISIESGINSFNNITGGNFSPAMKACNFRYFRRPNFEFAGEESEVEHEE